MLRSYAKLRGASTETLGVKVLKLSMKKGVKIGGVTCYMGGFKKYERRGPPGGKGAKIRRRAAATETPPNCVFFLNWVVAT